MIKFFEESLLDNDEYGLLRDNLRNFPKEEKTKDIN
jgi:hypothetical protein